MLFRSREYKPVPSTINHLHNLATQLNKLCTKHATKLTASVADIDLRVSDHLERLDNKPVPSNTSSRQSRKKRRLANKHRRTPPPPTPHNHRSTPASNIWQVLNTTACRHRQHNPPHTVSILLHLPHPPPANVPTTLANSHLAHRSHASVQEYTQAPQSHPALTPSPARHAPPPSLSRSASYPKESIPVLLPVSAATL